MFPGRSGKWMFASVPSPRDTLTLRVGVGTVRLFGRIVGAFWGTQRQTALPYFTAIVTPTVVPVAVWPPLVAITDSGKNRKAPCA